MIIGILGVFAFLLVINIPISFVLCIVGTVFIVVTGIIPLDTIPHKMWNGLDQFVYTAIPMFMEKILSKGFSRPGFNPAASSPRSA